MLAGHETSSVALSWILHHLSVNISKQTKLRDELLEHKASATARGDDAFTADDFASMPYLDAVVVSLQRL